jgi:hypothetical protein
MKDGRTEDDGRKEGGRAGKKTDGWKMKEGRREGGKEGRQKDGRTVKEGRKGGRKKGREREKGRGQKRLGIQRIGRKEGI